jgi:hypothetical protein
VPSHYRRRLDQAHDVDGLRPNSAEPNPEQPVREEKPRATWASPLQDAQLMAQGYHLKLQRGAATNAKREERDDGGKKGDHRQMCYDDIAENLRYLKHL